jgi:putative membrane protein
MKRLNGFFYFLSAFIATGTLLLFAVLPLRLNRSIWHGYRLLVVPTAADIEPYISAAERAGIPDIVSELAIDRRFALLGSNNHGLYPFTDQQRYGQWFSDENSTLRYLYIPYTSFAVFIKFFFLLVLQQQLFYLEPAFPYMLINAVLAGVLFICCLAGSQKKTLFFSAAFGFLCYAASVRSSLSGVTALLSILSVAYWLEALESDTALPLKQLKERIQHNVFMLILPAVPLIIAAADGLVPFLFFVLAVVLSVSAAFSVYSFLHLRETYLDGHRQHPPLKIFAMHPQSWTQFWHTRYACTVTILTGCLLLIAAVYPLIGSFNRLDRSITMLSIPQPASRYTIPFTAAGFFTARNTQQQDSLPDLTNYIEDYWYAAALPYLNVHNPLPPLLPNTQVHFDSFTEDAAGVLHREEKVVVTFNTAFIQHVLKHERIALLPLEKMLRAQQGFVTVSVQPLKIRTLGLFTAFFISFSTLLFPGILIIITKLQ